MSTITAAERAEIRDMAQQLARCQLVPRAARLDGGEQQALAECWQMIVDTGLDRGLLGERYGGAGLAVGDLLEALSELAVGDGGLAMCVLLSNAALAMLDGEQLDAIEEGERWALALAHSDADLVSREGSLDGELGFALGAYGADGLVLLHAPSARRADALGALRDGLSPATWAVTAANVGLTIEREQTQMGLRGAPAATVTLRGVQPLAASEDAEDGLAIDTDLEEGSASEGAGPPKGGGGPALDAAGALALVRAGTAAIAQGIAARAHELALDYAHDRQQGGVAIVEHDAVRDMLSAMAVRLRCWPSAAADSPNGRSRLSAEQALAAKIAASDAAMATAIDAVQVFGGTGYMVETGVEKLMRDAKYCQLYPEPNWAAHDELMRLRARP